MDIFPKWFIIFENEG